MEVRGTTSVAAAYAANSTGNVVQPPKTAKTDSSWVMPKDEVQFSNAAQLADQVSQAGGGLRSERLTQIRAAIEAGVYETPEKMELALSRMLEQVLREADLYE